ncbi:MAG: DNA adenine methylase [Planctomycetota bacterium]
MRLPHPIPYQGSKRNIAADILGYFPGQVATLIEPFAGSAAVTIAAAARELARRYWLNDLNKPLMDLWDQIINHPEAISRMYNDLWHGQEDNPREYYDRVRDKFNLTGRPDLFLYLLARCVKASVRYNANGEFNQSPDNRRCGARPSTMRRMILSTSGLLKGRTRITSRNYRDIIAKAKTEDLVYMDPPYQGVCGNRDSRYLTGVQLCEFVEALKELNQRGIRYIVSYDGRTGKKVHGKVLPSELELTHVEIDAGRSSQATLLGREDVTVESLYLSPALSRDLPNISRRPHHKTIQMPLFVATA